MRKLLAGLLIGYLLVVFCSCDVELWARSKKVIKVGYFPNITHAQALIGISDGTFQKELGRDTRIHSFVFNAGPSVIEAMMSGHLDLAYIGPNPAINGYMRTKGALLKIIAGAASGGAAFVVRGDLGVKKVEQLGGGKVASPQIGNTQDVALRYYLKKNGLKPLEQGGTIQILPIANPDQLTLFLKKEISGAWTVEPWVSRLVEEANGVILVDERNLWPDKRFVTANIIVSQVFLKKNSRMVRKWLKAHVLLTERLNKDLPKTRKLVNEEIKKITGKPLPESIIAQAFKRFELTYDPLAESLFKSADHAFELGFLGKRKPNLSRIYDLQYLNQVLKELKLPAIKIR